MNRPENILPLSHYEYCDNDPGEFKLMITYITL